MVPPGKEWQEMTTVWVVVLVNPVHPKVGGEIVHRGSDESKH